MSVINLKNLDDIPKCDVHYIPCELDCTENPNKDVYFKQKAGGSDSILTSSLRGYPLVGKKLDLPAGYSCVLLTEPFKPRTATQSRTFRAAGMTESITAWNWDKTPSRNDPLISALDWIHIAEAVHDPIEDDSIEEPENK